MSDLGLTREVKRRRQSSFCRQLHEDKINSHQSQSHAWNWFSSIRPWPPFLLHFKVYLIILMEEFFSSFLVEKILFLSSIGKFFKTLKISTNGGRVPKMRSRWTSIFINHQATVVLPHLTVGLFSGDGQFHVGKVIHPVRAEEPRREKEADTQKERGWRWEFKVSLTCWMWIASLFFSLSFSLATRWSLLLVSRCTQSIVHLYHHLVYTRQWKYNTIVYMYMCKHAQTIISRARES